MQKDDGTVLIEQNAILKETEQFYKNLYSSRDSELEDINLNEYVGHTMKTITDDQANNLEGILTLEEISCTLKKYENGKSPGLSGFPADFFKVFWKQLGVFVLRSLNHGYTIGELSITQKQGILLASQKTINQRFF